MSLKNFFLLMAIVGTVVPWIFFGSFIGSHGLDVIGFIKMLFANGPASGFSSDVLISLFVFWVWSYFDAANLGVRQWWLVFPAAFLVGLSLAMPLYLYFRESAKEAQAA